MAASASSSGAAPPNGAFTSLAQSLLQLDAAASAVCPSLDPSEFVWATPSAQQQQHQLYQLAFLYCALPWGPAAAMGAAGAAHQLASSAMPSCHQAAYGFCSPATMSSPVTPVPSAPSQQPTPAQVPQPAIGPSQPASGKASKQDSKAKAQPAAKSTPKKSGGSKSSNNKATKQAAQQVLAAAAAAAAGSAMPTTAQPAAAQPAMPPCATGTGTIFLAAGDASAMELDADDLRKFLESDRDFMQLEGLEPSSEGSLISVGTADGHNGLVMPRTASHGSVGDAAAMGHQQQQANDGMLFAAFDLDESLNGFGMWPAGGAPLPAPVPLPGLPSKADSGDLNNMAVCPSTHGSPMATPSSTPCPGAVAPGASAPAHGPCSKAVRTSTATSGSGGKAPKDGAAAAAKDKASGGGALRAKGGVSKASAGGHGGKDKAKDKDCVAKASAALAAAAEDVVLTTADLSRLLGEDDGRIPDGWDLDLDFENPFSTPISAF